MMLEPGDDDLIVLLNILTSPALRNQVDCLGGSAHEDDLARSTGIEEPARLLTGRLVGICCARSEFVRGAMHIGVFVLVKVADAIDHRLRLCVVAPLSSQISGCPFTVSRRMGKSRRIASTSNEYDESPRSPRSGAWSEPGAMTGTTPAE